MIKVRTVNAEHAKIFLGYEYSIEVKSDGTGQVLIGYESPEGNSIRKMATIPEVWAYLERCEAVNAEEFDAWVQARAPALEDMSLHPAGDMSARGGSRQDFLHPA